MASWQSSQNCRRFLWHGWHAKRLRVCRWIPFSCDTRKRWRGKFCESTPFTQHQCRHVLWPRFNCLFCQLQCPWGLARQSCHQGDKHVEGIRSWPSAFSWGCCARGLCLHSEWLADHTISWKSRRGQAQVQHGSHEDSKHDWTLFWSSKGKFCNTIAQLVHKYNLKLCWIKHNHALREIQTWVSARLCYLTD